MFQTRSKSLFGPDSLKIPEVNGKFDQQMRFLLIKKKMKKNILVFIVVVLVLSCNSDTETAYYKTGEIMFEVPLKEGKYHGMYRQYYPDGTLSGEIEYYNGKKNGTSIGYDSSGYQMNHYNYRDGITDGYFEVYFPKTSDIKIKGYYKKDKPDSLGFEYYKSKKLRSVYYYDMGQLDYLKSYDTLGVMYQSKIRAVLYPRDTLDYYPLDETHKVYIELAHRYSFGEGNRIGVIIGELDENDNLIDTLTTFGSNSGELFFKYQAMPSKIGDNYLDGILYEIKMPEQEIIGTTTFRYSYKVK
ncbi:MAG: hypothetical protein OEW67_14695 [Cyclobacteriaceae bacterium]|nr:hypothetical protein [Cyclobacteriaceae bacterium]